MEEVDEPVATDPEELKKDPLTCFFENQHHAHGSRWTPNYNKCFSCSCQVQTTRGNDSIRMMFLMALKIKSWKKERGKTMNLFFLDISYILSSCRNGL